MAKSIYECKTISMLQPAPLPGSFNYDGTSIKKILEMVLREAEILAECGFDAFIIQNMGDMPVKQISKPETIAYLTIIANTIRYSLPETSLGILVNWDGMASLAVAEAAGADFIRVEHVYTGVEVTSTGLFQAQCCEITEMKKRLGSEIPVIADVYEPHGVPLGRKLIEDAAWESVYEAFADGLFLSGNSVKESVEMVTKARKRVPDTKIFLGGGATADNVADLLKHFDGVCVARWIRNGALLNPIDKERAKRFVENTQK